MGSRRDNRGPLMGPTHRPAHAKMDHERRNHELLKRLASDVSTHKTTKSVLGVSPMSKSLTEELEKGTSPGQDLRGKTRGRKKSDLDKALKSFQRQTSSSMLKMSNVGDNMLEAKVGQSPPKNTRRRESSPGKSSNLSSRSDKRGNHHFASDNSRKSDVFERLSKMDSNKSFGRPEHPASNKTLDRSPLKSGRRSPQEKNSSDDKHLSGGRKTGVSDAHMKPTRRRDVSPGKNGEVIKREAHVRRSTIISGGVRKEDGQARDDDDASTEKQQQENVPETVDKDRDDPPIFRGSSLPSEMPSCPTDAGRSSTQQEQTGGVTCSSRPSVEERQKQAGSASQVGGRTPGRNKTSPQAATCVPARRSPEHTNHGGTNGKKQFDRKPERKTSSKTTTIVEPSKKPDVNEDTYPCKVGNQQTSTRPADGKHRSPKMTPKAEVVTLPSACDVLQKVRERVSDGNVQKSADGVRPAVVDDDKDVCEADKAEDDREFYKISVQTRLVTYNNSTLVIKNTSKSEGVDEIGASSDTEAESASDHTTNTTLQTSSAGAAGTASADVEPDTTHSPPCPTEALQEEDGAGELTRTRSVRRKLAQFVSKGKSFLSDVYSATQTKLEQYTRAESPYSSSSSDTAGDYHREDTDSGYYSIPPPLVETNPLWVDDHVRGDSWPQDNCYDGVGPVTSLGTLMAEAGVTEGGHPGITEDAGVEDEDATDVRSHGDEEQGKEDATPLSRKVDEDWIKKNILCTCECKDRTAKSGSHVVDPGQTQTDELEVHNKSGSKVTEENTVAPGSGAVEGHSDALNHSRQAPSSQASSRESDLGVREGNPGESEGERESNPAESDGDGEMCYCSCHDTGHDPLPHLPQEVQELLDADHARMWWTITGNFGNILPIDWSKTYTRQQYLPVLNLNEIKDITSGTPDDTDGGTEENAEEEEEEVAQDLDLHHLILNGLTEEPVKTAEEVIQEIDDIMQEGSSSEDECVDSSSSGENTEEPTSRPFPPPLYAEKLKNMSVAELNESLMELELVIRQYSETLISQLALRDELEYEKELKNSFISLLLQVQNKRRNFNVEKKKQKKVGPNGTDPKYLTTVIPYDVGHGPPHNPTLQILIKILMAINEDSPTVPTLLTDYILKVLCPS
ncbi:uncharacterized protein Unc-76 [Panulirus ornatus]|uniref:uncharacterized protein Unc-76 n=1 Tax=Panulirus ornatus TaxID=150431 RepID=UPI003A87D5B1